MALFDPPYVFLTTKPQNRLLSVDHPEWLSILPLQVPTDPVHLYVNIAYYDNADVESELINGIGLTEGVVKNINISYTTRDYTSITPGKTIKSITFYTKSDDDAFDIDETPSNDQLTYYPYTPKGEQILPIYYHNSYGGIDSLIAIGDNQEHVEYTHLKTRLAVVAVNQNQTDHNYMLERGVASREFSFWTGPKTKKEIQALRCLMLINRAYHFQSVDGQLSMIPIIIEGKAVQFPTERSNIWDLKFSYRYTFDDRAFDRVL